MGLQEYWKKRNFDVTQEPAGEGGVKPSAQLRFVVQKHAASHLHYDFRLELDGVLKSWAVPKGPSLDPKERRLAMHVEDHPIEYATFEGIIPKGQYGGGTVMLWDEGTWESLESAHKTYHEGHMKFHLRGHKLQGVWALIRLKDENGKSWLLIKDRDDSARAADEFKVSDLDKSVATGRSMEEIASGQKGRPPKIWHSKEALVEPTAVKSARKMELPHELSPQLASLAPHPPTGEDWIHEIKHDGYRILARLEKGAVQLLSRSGKDWTSKFPAIARAVLEVPLQSAFLDGELVALTPDGKSSFQKLQHSLEGKSAESLVYYVFDMPFAAGKDLRKLPLLERKGALQEVLAALPAQGTVRYCEHIQGMGAQMLEQVCQLGLEGIVSKDPGAPYESRRTSSWLKIRCQNQDEFVVIGFSDPQGGRSGFGALLLAQHEEDELVYCGKVGTGFDEQTLEQLHQRLAAAQTQESPLAERPKGLPRKGLHWVRPELVAQVRYSERTEDGVLRQPVFLGLREDKAAGSLVAEARPLDPRPAGVTISHPDRMIDEKTGLTKLQLANYYASVAPALLRHIGGRPLTVVRCPEGNKSPGFYQKHVKGGLPKSVHSLRVEEDDGPENCIMVDDAEGLLGLVQMGGLEFHPWGSEQHHLEQPDRLIFDLDPDEDLEFGWVVVGALELRQRLLELGLESFCKTSGGKGLHVVVPLVPRADWEAAKGFCKAVAEKMAKDDPRRYVSNMAKARRRHKIFIDYLRNGRGATSVAAYSARSRPGCPISTPLSWDEVDGKLDTRHFTVAAWRGREHDENKLWPGFEKVRQSLTQAILKKA